MAADITDLLVVAPVAFLAGLFAGLLLSSRYRIVLRKQTQDDQDNRPER